MSDARPTTSDQKFVGVWIGGNLFRAVESARQGKDRSQFVRDALRAFCNAAGENVGELAAMAPERLGKGGPKPRPRTNGKGDYPEHVEQISRVEERASSPPAPDPKGKHRRLNMIHPRT